MNEFEYGIEVVGLVIAWFLHEHDRDICLDALREAHDDCSFSPVESRGKD